jgi:hypothetical protein
MKQAVIGWLKSTAFFLAKGSLIMWGYTINMVVLSWYATMHSKAIDSSVAAMYIAALGAFVGKKGYDQYQQSKTTKKMENGDV